MSQNLITFWQAPSSPELHNALLFLHAVDVSSAAR